MKVDSQNFIILLIHDQAVETKEMVNTTIILHPDNM